MLQLHTRKNGSGYVGSVVYVLRGRRLWSESCGITRITREDARKDAEWLRTQQEIAGKNSLN